MLGRMVATAALIALAAGCAGMESAGRNARVNEPARVASAPPAAPAPAAPSPAPIAAPPPQAVQATPPPSAPPPAMIAQSPVPQAERPVASASRADEDDTVVVPGVRERQVQPPNGDPRSNAERMEDIRAWDQCVMRVQGAAEANPMRPQLDTPEDYCRQSLGMSDRTALPASRLERR